MERSMSVAERIMDGKEEESAPSCEESGSHCQETPGIDNRTIIDERRDTLQAENSASGFVSALTLISETQGSQSSEAKVDLSPGFRNAAAMAGWDDDALLLAALEDNSAFETQVGAVNTPEGRGRPVGCRDRCGRCAFCREKKREVRTPGQAITPLSANRRSRRPRRHSGNEGMPELPMAALKIDSVPCNEKRDPPDHSAETQKASSESSEAKDSESEKENQTSELIKDHSHGVYPKSLHLDQLKEELSCAVCLEICYEPSTTSCGHSFCKSCLQSVIQKCGPRCPKCRKPMRSDAVKPCSINTVLWNTIQILFPEESTRRAKEKQESSQEETSSHLSDSSARAARASSWPNSVVRASSTGLSRARPSGNFRRPSQIARASQHRPIVSSDEEIDPENAYYQTTDNNTSQARHESSHRVGRRERRPQTQQQELMDAALASRLQAAELLQANSHTQNVIDLERELDSFHSFTERRQHTTLSAATANLRTMASRPFRYRSRHHM
ncbi:hypothetical protein O6H91_09G022800 [Diphasiastrum complanatum]|uniref:Uncharacterized protein n=1 Tax=Diphasiastrum complanatum TaxID=34168 RepID=A0ACC2CM24_DIPCM|nr:hypothetical protein O6H91_09G022800 [Diphasiastrum complanatum]